VFSEVLGEESRRPLWRSLFRSFFGRIEGNFGLILDRANTKMYLMEGKFNKQEKETG
jgi:hypothetical protein